MNKSEITKYKKSIPESEKHLFHFSIDRSEWKRGDKITDRNVIHIETRAKAENFLKVGISNAEIEKINVDGENMGKGSFLVVKKGERPISLEKTIEKNDILTLLWGADDMEADKKAKAKKEAEEKESK